MTDNGVDGGKVPSQAIAIGGKGSDNLFHYFKTDTNGNLSTAEASAASGGASTVNSAAYEASHVLKASAGTLMSCTGYNSKASAQFIQLFNSATVPADTAVPVAVITAAASSNFSFSLPVAGMPFTTGIAISNSSTGPTKTIGSADVYYTAVIK